VAKRAVDQSEPLTPVLFDGWIADYSDKTRKALRRIYTDLVLVIPAAVFLDGPWRYASAGALGVAFFADVGRWYVNRKFLAELREVRAFVDLDEKLIQQVWFSVTGHNREHARKLLLERKRLRSDFKKKHPKLTENWTP
jgi:hypothetical protein